MLQYDNVRCRDEVYWQVLYLITTITKYLLLAVVRYLVDFLRHKLSVS